MEPSAYYSTLLTLVQCVYLRAGVCVSRVGGAIGVLLHSADAGPRLRWWQRRDDDVRGTAAWDVRHSRVRRLHPGQTAAQHCQTGTTSRVSVYLYDCVWAAGRNAPMIRFLTSALYIYCLLVHIVCFLTYPFFFIFPYLSPPLLIFSFENRPTLFPGRMSLKASQPGFSFWCLFCVVVHFFWFVKFFPYQGKRFSWGNVSEMTFFVWSGT